MICRLAGSPRNGTIMKPSSITLAACLAVAIGSNASATNLITNGDFEIWDLWNDTRDKGFTSDYYYRQFEYNYQRGGSGLIPGAFVIVTQASDAHYDWLSGFYDHTLGNSSGHYFVANGSTDTNAIPWESRAITVSQTHTPYRFEAWIANVFSADFSKPRLSFQIGDGMTAWTNLGAAASLDNVNPGVWLHTYVDFEFESTGTYYVRLMNANGNSSGNDLGLDDIYFGLRSDSPSFGTDLGPANPALFDPVPVPEPSAWALALAGVACGGCTMFRRRSQA
jgi:hypothetical protein